MAHRHSFRRVLALCLTLALLCPMLPVKAAEKVAVWKPSAASTEETAYTKLSSAIAKVNESGGYVKLLQDVHVTTSTAGGYAITVERGFTLDLDGHTLSSSQDVLRAFYQYRSSGSEASGFDALPDEQKTIRICNGTLYTDVDETGNVLPAEGSNKHQSFLVNIYRGYLQMEHVTGHSIGQCISFYSPDKDNAGKGFLNIIKNCDLAAEDFYTFVFNDTTRQKDMNLTVEDSTLVSLDNEVFGSRGLWNTVTLEGANKFYIPRSLAWHTSRSDHTLDTFSGGTARDLGITADAVTYTQAKKYTRTFENLRLLETERITDTGTETTANLQKAIVETAIAFYNRGKQAQYDSINLAINGNTYGSSSRSSGSRMLRAVSVTASQSRASSRASSSSPRHTRLSSR